MRYFFLILALLILGTGCSMKQAAERLPKKETKIRSGSYLITIKTKKFAFSDTGFLTHYPDKIDLQVFTAGKPVLEMKVYTDEDNICVQNVCKYKHGFNRFYLSGAYPDTLIENILQMRPIMNGKNLKKTEKGFTQKITADTYDISYSVTGHNLRFKDSKNRLILKLKELEK